MLSLKSRRIYFDLILMYKSINHLSDLKFDQYFVKINSGYSLRSHCFQIKPKFHFNSSQWLNSYFGRVPGLWNSLPNELVICSKLDEFKTKLKSHLLKIQFLSLESLQQLQLFLFLIFQFLFSYKTMPLLFIVLQIGA